MIPPVEERQVRPCNLCVGFDTDIEYCQHDFGIIMLRRNYVRDHDNAPPFFVNIPKYTSDAAKEYPC